MVEYKGYTVVDAEDERGQDVHAIYKDGQLETVVEDKLEDAFHYIDTHLES
ncbi:MAG: hypothetical protein ACI35P_01670 [Bacillus sp. (in: firmicutes)]